MWGRSRRWEDNIRTHTKEAGWEGVDWMSQAEYRKKWWAVVNAEISSWVP